MGEQTQVKIYENFEEMLKENKFLVSIETVKIKDFIFNTDKLKTIRGASYLLDYLNQVEVPKILETENIKYNSAKLGEEIYKLEDEKFLEKIDNYVDENIDKRIIYIGAGNAKFFVENEEIAKRICKKVKEKYEKMAPSVKVVTEYEEIKEGQKVWDVIDNLAKKTAIKKSEGFPLLNIDLPFVEKCELSGSEPAVISKRNYIEDLKKIGIHETGYEGATEEEKDGKQREPKEIQKEKTEEEIKKVLWASNSKNTKISEATAAKIKFSNKMIKDDVNKIGFYSIIKEAINDIYLGTEISNYSVGDSFIGLVYSDGDGLGDFLKGCKERYKTEEKYLSFLRRFSIVLDRNTKIALKEILLNISNKFKPIKVDGEYKKIVGEFLIVGGDDVCAIFPANIALEISYKFQKNFEEKMKAFAEQENDKFNNITSSGGVVIAKDKTPMYQLFEQGIKLQKSAKLKRYNDIQGKGTNDFVKTGYVDFQNIGGEGLVDIKEYRKNLFDEVETEENGKVEKIKLSSRPYSINKVLDNTITVNKLIEKTIKLKEKSFPNTKLRYIYDLKKDKTLTDNEKIMEAVNILSKMGEDELSILDEIWGIKEKMILGGEINKLFEDILDVVEMYDFITGINEGEKISKEGTDE